MAIAGTLEIQLMADVARIRADMEKAKGIVDKGAAAMTNALSMVGRALGGLGVGIGAAGLLSMVKQINDGVDALNDLRDATGSSIENISALERVQRLYGHAAGTAGNTLIKFNQSLGQTQKPGSDVEKVLTAIGLRVQDLKDMDPAEALQQTAIALSRYADDGNKARAVQELFGKSLKEMAPFLKDLAESGKLQATVTTEQAAEAEKFNQELFKMQTYLVDVGRAIASPVISRMNELIERFRDASREGESLFVTLAKMGALPVPPWVNLIYQGAAKAMGGATDPKNQIANLQKLLDTDSSLTASERSSYTAQIARERSRLNDSYARGVTAADSSDAFSRRFGRASINLPIEDKEAAAAAKKAAKEAAAEAKKEREEQLKRDLEALEEEAKIQAEINELLNNEQKLRAKHITDGTQIVTSINLETEALTMTNVEREKAVALRDLEKTGIDKTSAAYRQLAADISAAVERRESTRESKQFSEDLRGDLRGALQRAFEDSKNPAKAFVEAFASTMYTRLSSKISDAILDSMLGKQGGPGGGLLSSFMGAGGITAAFSQTGLGASGFGTGLAYGSQDMGQFLHSGGVVGGVPSFYRGIHSGVFHGAPRFHTGGIAGDEVPIIAKRGEGVFTPAQMRALGRGGGGGQTVVHQNIMVGDFVNKASMRQEVASAQRQAFARQQRAVNYGGAD